MSDAEVIDFAAAKEARTPHMQGRTKCLACGHVEVAVVAPVGVQEMECAACGLMRSVWAWPLGPAEEVYIWKCNCGGELFYLQATQAPMCATCGAEQSGYE